MIGLELEHCPPLLDTAIPQIGQHIQQDGHIKHTFIQSIDGANVIGILQRSRPVL